MLKSFGRAGEYACPCPREFTEQDGCNVFARALIGVLEDYPPSLKNRDLMQGGKLLE